MVWKITNYKSIKKNTVVGSFDLEVPPMFVKGWTYHRKDDGSAWVNPPQREFTRDDGSKGYQKLVFFPNKEHWARFQRWCLEELEKIVPATGVADPAPEGDNIPF